MPQDYDVSLKLLFRRSTGVAATALFGGPVAEWLNVELPKVENPRVDLLARGTDDSLRHVEFQSKNENQLARREAEYYLGFHRLLGEHVDQVVLYVGSEPLRMKPVFETPSMRFQYRLMDVREWDGEPLLESEDLGDNIMAVLTLVDQERVFARVEEQVRKLEGEEKEESARLFVLISGLRGLAKAAMERMHMIDLMENEVFARNIRKGLEEGRREGEASLLLTQLEERFGVLPTWVSARLKEASETQLMGWAKRILSSATLDDVFTPNTSS